MIIRTSNFSLDSTLRSGQLFRFIKQDDWHYIFAGNQLFKAQQKDGRLFVEGTTRRFAKNFFGLDHDITHIHDSITKDDHIKSALSFEPGLRLLNQEFWECAVGFICSSCASIPKITLNLNLLAKKFGERVSLDEVKGHTFPTPGSLCSLQKIKNARTGYRSKYLYAFNNDYPGW